MKKINMQGQMNLKGAGSQQPAEVLLGHKLREMRTSRGFSLRALAERCGLNVNTLSMIETGKTSPSVSTLQLLAQGLGVSVAAFFEDQRSEKKVVFTPAKKAISAFVGTTRLQNLGKDLAGAVVQPFMVTLQPGLGSGEQLIVHTGHEFVHCLEGSLHYEVDGVDYLLEAGDTLLFESHLPHRWQNISENPVQVLLVFFPADKKDEIGGRHFSIEYQKKDVNMKIAVITEDGKTISRHFGRAPYYMVLTLAEGVVSEREMRAKLGHGTFNAGHAESEHGEGHGRGQASHNKHLSMAEVISDCKVLLCGGMGMGAYESMRSLGIQTLVTDLVDIDEAVKAFVDGKLIDHTELLH